MNINEYNRYVRQQRFKVGDIIKYTHPTEKTSKSHRALSEQYGDRYYRVVQADPVHASIESMNSDDVFSIFQWTEFKIVMLEEYLKYGQGMSNWSEESKANRAAGSFDTEDF